MKLDNYHYLTGFGNHFESQAIEGALPKGRNTPQKPPLGLYAEQLSGSAFTVKRDHNAKVWLYRILPSVKHTPYQLIEHPGVTSQPSAQLLSPNQLRWSPLEIPQSAHDFIQGLRKFAVNGNVDLQTGAAIYLYTCNRSMQDNYFHNADGDILIVLQLGELIFKTELGTIYAKPQEIVVIPRGMKFQVACVADNARGYVLENFGAHFSLAERGPIGANGLANERDFLVPSAQFENKSGEFKLLTKFHDHLWQCDIDHSPLDVVAWHGNYVPYKYDLTLFNTMNSVSYDHADPSIFTVLSSLSDTPGVANIDFVIFPERWIVAENTFRPPYYHRNTMSEFMGLIYGEYDAKPGGFKPGGCSLHNCMSPHGPDVDAFNHASEAKLKPQYYSNTLAFMFESRFMWHPTKFALESATLDKNYLDCWQGLQSNFKDK
ncbi:MAG: homogentisate 1,2-dioxygenase [Pseudomonadota bacterium]